MGNLHESEYPHFYPLEPGNLYSTYGEIVPHIVFSVSVYIAFYKTTSQTEKEFSPCRDSKSYIEHTIIL